MKMKATSKQIYEDSSALVFNFANIDNFVSIYRRDSKIKESINKLISFINDYETQKNITPKHNFGKVFARLLNSNIELENIKFKDNDKFIDSIQSEINYVLLSMRNVYKIKGDALIRPYRYENYERLVDSIDTRKPNTTSNTSAKTQNREQSTFRSDSSKQNNTNSQYGGFMGMGRQQGAQNPWSKFYPYLTKPKAILTIKQIAGIFAIVCFALYAILQVYTAIAWPSLKTFYQNYYSDVMNITEFGDNMWTGSIINLAIFGLFFGVLINYFLFAKRNDAEKYGFSKLFTGIAMILDILFIIVAYGTLLSAAMPNLANANGFVKGLLVLFGFNIAANIGLVTVIVCGWFAAPKKDYAKIRDAQMEMFSAYKKAADDFQKHHKNDNQSSNNNNNNNNENNNSNNSDNTSNNSS